MICHGCRRETADGFSFCPYCGAAFSVGAPLIDVPGSTLQATPIVEVATKDPTPPINIPSARTNEIGTYVFGTFAVISLLVSISKGLVPIYLIESAAWAGGAWYWHRKQQHSELSKAVVIVLAALIFIGEGIQIISKLRSEPTQTRVDTSNPIDLDSFAAGNNSGTNASQTVGVSGTSAAARAADLENVAVTLFNQKQYRESRPLFEQACNGTDENGFKYVGVSGEMKACNYLGYLYARGLGGPLDVNKAKDIYQRACEQGILTSCASLGSLYQNSGNHEKARQYFQRACKGGLAESCELQSGVQ